MPWPQSKSNKGDSVSALLHIFYLFAQCHCDSEKFTKKLLGESEIEGVLQRLDRLTQDEARMTVAQTLGVVHGLVGNVKLVMEGTECLHDCSQIVFRRWSCDSRQMERRQRIVFDRIWVCVSCGTCVIRHADWSL